MIKTFHLFDPCKESINEEILINMNNVIYIKRHQDFPDHTIIKLKDNSIIVKENFESVKKTIGVEKESEK